MVYDEYFGGKIIRGYPLKMFVAKFARGNAVQFSQDFPAKRRDDTFVINLIEYYLTN